MEINNVTFYFVTHNAEVPSSMSTEKRDRGMNCSRPSDL